MKLSWSAETLNAGRQAAELRERFGVSPALHPRDFIFNSLVYSKGGDIEAAYDHYLAHGRADAERVVEIVAEALPDAAQGPLRLLDFAAGYGRVTRHFGRVAPGWQVEAADIHWRAKRFNRRELGIRTHLSSYFPRLLLMPAARFDAVFCLSFFSHVRDRQFAPWLKALLRLLREGGVLVLTTHGEVSRPLIGTVELDEAGYGMVATSEQFDIPTRFYVHACTSRAYVERRLAEAGGSVERYEQGAWFGHQDLFVIRRLSSG